MYQRGYRQKNNRGSLKRKILLAGIITLSGWDSKEPLLDPMCGSGTLPIEAAMMALNIYPGMNRTFGFNHWHDFDKEVFHKIKVELKEKQIEKELNIYASDIDRQAFNAASNQYRPDGIKALYTN